MPKLPMKWNTRNAYYQVKTIRKRTPGGNSLYGPTDGISEKEIRKELQNEQQARLTYDDHRYRNVRRWKIASATRNIVIKATKIISTIADRTPEVVPAMNKPRPQFSNAYDLFPIMQSKLAQNPNLTPSQGSEPL